MKVQERSKESKMKIHSLTWGFLVVVPFKSFAFSFSVSQPHRDPRKTHSFKSHLERRLKLRRQTPPQEAYNGFKLSEVHSQLLVFRLISFDYYAFS